MRRTLVGSLVSLVLPLVVSAQTPPWLNEGERLTYDLSYFRVLAGSLAFEASHVPGAPTIRVTSRATSSPFVSRFAKVDEQLETLLDPTRATVLSSRRRSLEDQRWVEEIVLFDASRGIARRWKGGQEKEAIPIPTPVLDTLASIYWMRTLPLEPGREFRLDVQAGRRVYPLVVTTKGRERVKGPDGVVEALVVVPRFREGGLLRQKGELTLWVTTDPTHIPLRIRSELAFGSLTATLGKIERPWPGVVESGGGS